MRALVLATLLLASSGLTSFAQDERNKPPISSPQSVPAQAAPPDQSLNPGNQPTEQSQFKGEERKVGRDWRIRRDEEDRINRDDRDMGRDVRRGDRDEYREEGGRYGDRDDRDHRGSDRRDRDRDYRSYDDDRPRRRVKVCVEYDNRDEYCRYRQGP